MGIVNYWNKFYDCSTDTMFLNVTSPEYLRAFPITNYTFPSFDSIFTPYYSNSYLGMNNYSLNSYLGTNNFSLNSYFDVGNLFSSNYFQIYNYGGVGFNSFCSCNPLDFSLLSGNPFSFYSDNPFNVLLNYTPAAYVPKTPESVSPSTIKQVQEVKIREPLAELELPENIDDEEVTQQKPTSVYPGSEDKRYTTFMEFLFGAEGGYVDDPDDAGGATNMGITQDTYDNYRMKHGLSKQSVINITKYEAHDIYYNDYYKESGADRLSDPKMALYVFDTAVNMGIGMAKKLLRESNGDLKTFESLRRSEYQRISKLRNNKKFLRGWLNRVDDVRKFASSLPSGLDVVG